MQLHFITLFPEIIENYLSSSVLGRALKKEIYKYKVINPRDFTTDRHHSVDDRPYGGGPGMILRADILEKALLKAFVDADLNIEDYDRNHNKVIVFSASGKKYTQQAAFNLAKYNNLFLVCGHYEGIDGRFIEYYADQEFSIGDYVLSGGELAALVAADSLVRLLPGVLGSAESITEESFNIDENGEKLVEYPQYTRPIIFNGLKVPEILLSGDHQKIEHWRKNKSIELSKKLK